MRDTTTPRCAPACFVVPQRNGECTSVALEVHRIVRALQRMAANYAEGQEAWYEQVAQASLTGHLRALAEQARVAPAAPQGFAAPYALRLGDRVEWRPLHASLVVVRNGVGEVLASEAGTTVGDYGCICAELGEEALVVNLVSGRAGYVCRACGGRTFWEV